MVKVLVTGVFDVLHSEHQKFLQKASRVGDKLIVALESDSRVKKLKSPKRPINNQFIRQQNLQKFNFIDQILILPQDFDQEASRLQFLQKIKPDILAVSASTPNLENKRKLMNQIKGRVVIIHSHNPKMSTTQLLGA